MGMMELAYQLPALHQEQLAADAWFVNAPPEARDEADERLQAASKRREDVEMAIIQLPPRRIDECAVHVALAISYVTGACSDHDVERLLNWLLYGVLDRLESLAGLPRERYGGQFLAVASRNPRTTPWPPSPTPRPSELGAAPPAKPRRPRASRRRRAG
jgi:hypothetical protein